MQNIFQQLDDLLEKVDFEAIWPGFAPCEYILFIDNRGYLKGEEIPWTSYMACTAMDYEGRVVATWVIENPDDIDFERVASGLAHEMFHAFQSSQNDRRGPDEFALFAYPQDLENYQLKLAENNYLAKAFAENSMTALEQFITLRKARARIIGDAIRQEWLCETGEGMAEYAGLMALNQLSPQKFAQDVDKHIAWLCDPESLFHVRRISYSVGCVMCLALKAVGIDFMHKLGDKRTLFEIIPQSPGVVEEHLEKRRIMLKNKFDAVREGGKKNERKATIMGFDPMNMWYAGNEVLCDRFVILDGEHIQGPLFCSL